MNRDRKHRKKPFSIDEFFVYGDAEDTDSIDAIYGASAKAMLELKIMPAWALFVYPELKKNASDGTAPRELCFIHPNAIILAPNEVDVGVCKGMLIATREVSQRVIYMDLIDIKGECIQKGRRVTMPEIPGQVYAMENCYLDIM